MRNLAVSENPLLGFCMKHVYYLLPTLFKAIGRIVEH